MPAVPLKHFLQISDFSLDEREHLIARTRWIKERFKRYEVYQPLRDRTLAMVFEKASTRTRVSFEAGMNQLGGIAINLTPRRHAARARRADRRLARVISRMVDVVMIRTFEQAMIERFAAHSRVPVINGLTNEFHPCQVLARYLHVRRASRIIRGRTVAWIGDSNNMCNTWLQAAEIFDFRVHVSTPPGYEVDRERRAAGRAISRHSTIRWTLPGADLVTTDVWTAWARGRERARARDFAGWRVDSAMMRQRRPMLCSCIACPRTAAKRSPPS